jgi:hypothetical protein
MVIDGRLPEGYVIVCYSRRGSHSFLVKQLGPSVECPKCGSTAISTGLATEFLAKQLRDRPAVGGAR